jgi:hypothetical protein
MHFHFLLSLPFSPNDRGRIGRVTPHSLISVMLLVMNTERVDRRGNVEKIYTKRYLVAESEKFLVD